VSALKTEEHRVNGCGIVFDDRGVQLLERTRKHHVICVQDEGIRRARQLKADVARVRQPGVEAFVDDADRMARVSLPRRRLL
jgi:hypothetical protein